MIGRSTFVVYMGQCLLIPLIPDASRYTTKSTAKGFGSKKIFVEAYPIKKKSDCHLGFDKFVKEYGAPDKMTYDGAQEQI